MDKNQNIFSTAELNESLEGLIHPLKSLMVIGYLALSLLALLLSLLSAVFIIAGGV